MILYTGAPSIRNLVGEQFPGAMIRIAPADRPNSALPPKLMHNGARPPADEPAPSQVETMPDRNAQWTIGTLIAVAIALSMQMSMQTSGLRADINQLRNEMNQRFTQLRNEMNQLRNEMNQRFSETNRRLESFDERLRNVEIALGKLDQRLEIIERIVLPDAPDPPE